MSSTQSMFPEAAAPIDGADAKVEVDEALMAERKTDFILSKRAESTIVRLTTELALDQDSRVSRSHLIRAMCLLLEKNREEIIRQVRAVKLGTRPPNGAYAARHQYEAKLANAMFRAMVLNNAGAANA